MVDGVVLETWVVLCGRWCGSGDVGYFVWYMLWFWRRGNLRVVALGDVVVSFGN